MEASEDIMKKKLSGTQLRALMWFVDMVFMLAIVVLVKGLTPWRQVVVGLLALTWALTNYVEGRTLPLPERKTS